MCEGRVEGLSRLHVYLRYAGRCDESIAVHLHAESLDPFSIVAIMEVGFAFYYARRFAEAAEQIQKAIALEPTGDQLYFGLGLVLLQRKRFDLKDKLPVGGLSTTGITYTLYYDV
jgi:Flp pilus assembly protein TadD